MQKWEYCEINGVVTVTNNEEGEPKLDKAIFMWYCKADEEKENIEYEDYSKLLAQLGIEGWEAVGFTTQTEKHSDGSSYITNYLLKRPLE